MTRTTRPAFTLVELLVAMGIIIALASIALLVVPDVLTQDRTTDGATTVRQYLMIAKARALRDGQPTGVRFLAGGQSNPAWVTEVQFVQQPQVIPAETNEELEISFPLAPAPTPPATTPPAGSVLTPPDIFYKGPNLPVTLPLADPVPEPRPNPLFIYLAGQTNPPPPGVPQSVVLEFRRGDERIVLRVTAITAQTGARTGQYKLTYTADPNFDTLVNTLGGTTTFSVNNFWASVPAQPLLGEPTYRLPSNVCVDLVSGRPRGTAGVDFDIIFAPNGQVLNSDGQIFLWVRDYTKPGGDPARYATADFGAGGEQQVVALKAKSGSLGTFPIKFPPYGTDEDAFTFARQAASQP